MRAAIYGRVSTNECRCAKCDHRWTDRTHAESARCPKCGEPCRDKRQDVGMQTRELRQFCEARGWQVVGEYLDEGISGAKEKRPELDRLMADAHRRKFDVVAVWKFDRFARSVSHLLRALETFGSLGIGFVSLSESLDTSTPAGKMVFTVLGAVAELERSLIAERVRAGLRNARAKGKRLGRPRVTVDASRIASLRATGMGWKKIAGELGVGVGTVLRVAQEASQRGSKNPASDFLNRRGSKIPRATSRASRVAASFR